MTRIEIVIDDLVLVGFAAHQRHQIADAIERELSTLSGDAQQALRLAVGRGSSTDAVRAADVGASTGRQTTAHRPVDGDGASSHVIGAGVGQSLVQAIVSNGWGASHG